MGRTKLTQKRLGELLGISQSRVAQLHARGMPTQTVDAARAWREANLDPVQSFAQGPAPVQPPRPAALPAPPARDLGEIVADLLDAAGVDVVARLVAESYIASIEDASVAVSAIAVALADALDRAGGDGEPVVFVAGPLSCLEGEPRAAVLQQIEARIAELRAELDADA